MSRRYRLLALLSHPIQYIVPLLRKLAADPRLDLTVCFMTETGLKPGFVKGYGETLKWDIPLLDGYRHKFLKNLSRRAHAGDPASKVNPGIALELVKGKYDAILMHGYVASTEWLALATARALGVKVLFWGDVLIDSPKRAGKLSIKSELFRHAWCKGIDAALALSTQARRFYAKYGVPEDRVFWVPLAVDNDYWSSKNAELRPKRAEIRRELGLDPDLPVVLYVAHMRPNKRPVDVVSAFSKMRTRASLVMVGAGPLYDDTVRFIQENKVERVHLAGLQNQSALPRYYAIGDVFVLPSAPGEVTPLVVHESMNAGLALVISDAVPSTIDFVREGENGFTYPCGDTDALADRLDRVLADPATTARMSAASRAIIEDWNHEVAVRGVVRALDRVVP
jgi:glycosyltransferase involved in cell wall biosynthesis